jgi:hypothetical protein
MDLGNKNKKKLLDEDDEKEEIEEDYGMEGFEKEDKIVEKISEKDLDRSGSKHSSKKRENKFDLNDFDKGMR